jgi:hypothetical protein
MVEQNGVIRPLDERERQLNDDYEWCLHDPEVRRRFGGQVVAAYRRTIWGAGKNHDEAGVAAEQAGCPAPDLLAFVVVPEWIERGQTVPPRPERFSEFDGVVRPLDERERQLNDDYEWCLHDPEVRRRFGGQVVAAYRRTIWGAGKNHDEAGVAAEQAGCPTLELLAFVAVPEGLQDPVASRGPAA